MSGLIAVDRYRSRIINDPGSRYGTDIVRWYRTMLFGRSMSED
jgi:hypothetical protein